MLLKAILYVVFTVLAIYALSSLNINGIFKKNSYYSSRLLYMMVSMGLAYLVVNFMYDFFTYSSFS